MRLPDLVTDRVDFTTISALRERLEAVAKERKVALDPKALNAWLETAADRIRRIGRLLTEQQYADYRSGRRLSVGDHARFIAESRVERVANGKSVERPHGQLGLIVEVASANASLYAVTFAPLEAQTQVTLRASVMGCGWPYLERVPEAVDATEAHADVVTS